MIMKVIFFILTYYCRSCISFLFYDNNNIDGSMREIADIDIFLQVRRESVGILNNIPQEYKHYTNQIFENIIKDGYYEGLSLGLSRVYSSSSYSSSSHEQEINRQSLVPYGCWFRRSEDSGIFVNLGTNILIDDRLHLYKQYKVIDDTYFCSNALNLGYTSIQLLQIDRNDDTEIVICYGECGTISFNTTCPPKMKIRKGYHAYDICNCNNKKINLNCDGNLIIDMKKPSPISLLDNNRCIMTTTNDLKSNKIYKNHVMDLMLYFTIDMFSSNRRNDELISSITSSIDNTSTTTKSLVLNLQTILLNNSIIPQNISRAPLYSMTLDFHTTQRKIININNIYIGIISNFKYKNNQLINRSWLLDDARCLKKLGAYMIILVGDYENRYIPYLMNFLHTYVDLIIGISDKIEFINNSSSIYLHYHNKSNFDDYSEIQNRMLMFERSNNELKLNYGKIHIQKLPDYKLMINKTTISIFSF